MLDVGNVVDPLNVTPIVPVFLQVAIGGVVHAGDRLTTTVPVSVVSRFFAREASAGATSAGAWVSAVLVSK